MRDTIDMARESWLDTYGLGKDHNSFVEALNRFAELVRADERAAPVQDPVATIDNLEQEIYENTREFVSLNVMEWLLNRLNTTPPAAQRQWVGLTDEEIQAVLNDPQKYYDTLTDFAHAIEAKLKEKNTP